MWHRSTLTTLDWHSHRNTYTRRSQFFFLTIYPKVAAIASSSDAPVSRDRVTLESRRWHIHFEGKEHHRNTGFTSTAGHTHTHGHTHLPAINFSQKQVDPPSTSLRMADSMGNPAHSLSLGNSSLTTPPAKNAWHASTSQNGSNHAGGALAPVPDERPVDISSEAVPPGRRSVARRNSSR